VDSDGFTTVRRKRGCAASRVGGSDDAGARVQAASAVRNSTVHDGDHGPQEGQPEVVEDACAWQDVDDEGGEVEDGPAPHQALWEAWQKAKAELRRFRQLDLGDDHWTVVEASARVDDAEEAWRAARPQAAISNRFRGAERAVNRATARAERVTRDIEQLEEFFNHQRQVLQDQLEAANAKVLEAEGRLRDLRAELGGAAAASSGADGDGDARVIQVAAQCLASEVGPALTSVADLLDSGDPAEAKSQVQAVLSRLSVVHSDLSASAERHAARGPRLYSLVDDDVDGADWEESDEEWENPAVARRGSPTAGATSGCGAASATPVRAQGPWPQDRQRPHAGDAGATAPAAAAAAPTARWSRTSQCHWEREGKLRRVDCDSMEEQSFADMSVPAHLEPALGGDSATQEEIRARCVAEFRAAAEARGVDITDVDLGSADQQQLEQLASERFW
jgi:hypothetical protein